MRQSNWRYATFLPARAGLSTRFRVHDLRHTAASLMIQAGYPPKMLQEILGHASITITKDVYGHLVEGDRRAVAASMSRALFGPESAVLALNMAPSGTKKAPSPSGLGSVTWARSEGLEPLTF
jgi:integrase